MTPSAGPQPLDVRPTPAAAPLPRTSLIVVSRHRPAALARCLAGVAQLEHTDFEVIVVADPAGLAAVQAAGLGPAVKAVEFDEANIAAARNAGIACAAGEVTAFIDDDAVPEPTWLSRLAAAFADGRVAAAGGFVRGRDGLSFQWRARTVDRTGAADPLEVPPDRISLWRGAPGQGIKTEGTNMAVRTDLLVALGGFDPAYRFYLDETDLNLRLAALGAVTAVVPGAQVVHGFLESARRRADRVPLSLHEVGASSAVFLRRHAPPADHGPALERLRADERRRLLAHMVAGRIEPRDVGRLLAGLEAGIAEGAARALGPMPPPLPLGEGLVPGADAAAPADVFLRFPGTGPRPGHLIAGRPWQGAALRRKALAALAAGEVVTVLRLSPTARRHRLRFDPAGYWEQTGGLWGRAGRDAPAPRFGGFAARVRAEAARTAPLRPVARHPAGRAAQRPGGKPDDR